MRIGVPQETLEGERRVALIPDTVKSLTAKDVDVTIESGAGVEAGFTDEMYTDAGADVGDAGAAWGADIVLRVAVPTTDEIGKLDSGKVLIGFLAPLTAKDTTKALASGGVTSFAVEAIPRITRAQDKDPCRGDGAGGGGHHRKEASGLAGGEQGGRVAGDVGLG